MKNLWKMKLLTYLSFLVCLNLSNGQVFGKCFTPDSFKGECVHLENCPALKYIHENQLEIYMKRVFLGLSNAACGHRDGKPLVCCREPRVPETTPAPTTPAPSVVQTRNPLLPVPGHRNGECGFDIVEKIYGGNKTKIDEFPWMALIQFTKPNTQRGFHCGGVVISDRYVLTASHCINGKDLPVTWAIDGVRLGEWDILSEKDCELFHNEEVCSDKHIDIAIEKTIPHELYEPYSLNQHHDIALIRLKDKIIFSDFIKPICLPLEEELRNNDFVGQTMSVAGWGKTQTSEASTVKLKTNVDGVTKEQCNTVYNKERRDIIDDQLCAGGVEHIDSCRGDSGGPLMRLDVPYWYLAGLVSFGPSPCGLKGWPGVYTRVGKYISWIEANMEP